MILSKQPKLKRREVVYCLLSSLSTDCQALKGGCLACLLSALYTRRTNWCDAEILYCPAFFLSTASTTGWVVLYIRLSVTGVRCLTFLSLLIAKRSRVGGTLSTTKCKGVGRCLSIYCQPFTRYRWIVEWMAMERGIASLAPYLLQTIHPPERDSLYNPSYMLTRESTRPGTVPGIGLDVQRS
jgi:hypothetical protein